MRKFTWVISRDIIGRFQPYLLTVKDKQCNALTDQDLVVKLVNRRKEYCMELYSAT